MSKKSKSAPSNLIGTNKKARHHYEFLETLEAGLVLAGSEVKSLREARVSFMDAHVKFKEGEAWLVGVHIKPYENTGVRERPDPDRPRKLLLHRKEILRLKAAIDQKGLTMVPVKMYFSRGKAKVQLALAKGKKVHDRREEIKRRDVARDTARQMARYE